MKKIFIICCSAFATNLAVVNANNACVKIKQLFLKGQYQRYSVELVEGGPGYLDYVFDLDRNNVRDHVKAYCGNGVGAICEMELLELIS